MGAPQKSAPRSAKAGPPPRLLPIRHEEILVAEEIARESVVVFSKDDLPTTRCGLSLYRGVIVCWDEDRDTRVLNFLDAMHSAERDKLFAVHESKACLRLVWRGSFIPSLYREESKVEVLGPGADIWTVAESTLLTITPRVVTPTV